MLLDRQTCSRARLSRDPRFDGKFFIAVLTTRVYCRSICSARTCQEKNVRYYPTAAAAEEAGFRPCLRCRPECSPGTPAWLGTPSTVTRGLRLLNERALDDGGIEYLAERLGIGGRHLRRLFLQHLGASPRAVAQTRRLHFAKKLIDETSLPMSEVSEASGFGCVRRFNANIRATFHRTPSQLRALARNAFETHEHEYVFRLRYRPPYHWLGMLDFLRPRATPGVECVTEDAYARSISLHGKEGSFEVTHAPEQHSLVLRVNFEDSSALFQIVERVRAMFDLNADWGSIAGVLENDRLLRGHLKGDPGRRLPGAWDGFELAVRAVLGQQISVAAATNLAGQIARKFGRPLRKSNGISHLFPTPEILADAASLPLPMKRAETIRALACAVRDCELQFDAITDVPQFCEQLKTIPGIGDWTAQYVALRALREPDAFPAGDLGLQKSLGVKSSAELERRAENWRPWRGYAAIYMWSAGHSL
ncbi:DNA-3-methyladenine glycosylase II [Candidatus Koribacter versatilis Ellin345]|uniref:DNA-3-methyladenine glycosylase II n=1 Tax=Koribacter versatilis (strain Ellin345) TaxID=204669 RepID=Q1IT49_KORVE|nr:AlkA N-terminal domain-containing protein [Candidatus Koribacter versatilis]ABF39951.1 DNA-3-methyladenine glycosylase II [Candidatus Koribacter versatilis Ellin345]